MTAEQLHTAYTTLIDRGMPERHGLRYDDFTPHEEIWFLYGQRISEQDAEDLITAQAERWALTLEPQIMVMWCGQDAWEAWENHGEGWLNSDPTCKTKLEAIVAGTQGASPWSATAGAKP